MNDLVDRRAPRRAGEDDGDDARESRAAGLWGALGFDRPDGGSPISDHASALALCGAAASAIAGGLPGRVSTRVRRWATADGSPRRRAAERPSRSTRDGHRPAAERNVRAYLLARVCELSLAELARELGLTRAGARKARDAGARVVADALAAGGVGPRLDPRRPPGGPPRDGKGSPRW